MTFTLHTFLSPVIKPEREESFIIKEEKAYARKSAMGDLGVRVQNSGTGDPGSEKIRRPSRRDFPLR